MQPTPPEQKNILWLHPSHQPSFRNTIVIVALLLLGLVFFWLNPPEIHHVTGYLPLHILLETIAIVVAMLVFAVGWNAHGRHQSGNVVLLACMFFGVGWLDFFHVLSYNGMPDFVTPSGPEKGLGFWLAARLMATAALFAVAIRSWRPFASTATKYLLFSAATAATACASWLFLYHLDWMPRTFVAGQGLTPFKLNFEYTIIAVNLLTALILWVRMRKPQPFNAALLFSAVVVMAMSEFFFTRYVTMTDIFNVLGHIYKVAAYLFLYRAIVVANIEHPYNQLRESQNQLQATLNAIPDLLFEVDLTGRYLDYRAVQTGLLAASPEGFLGKTIFEVLPPDVADIAMSALREANEQGYSHGKEIELIVPDGKRWFELSVSRKSVEPGDDPHFVVLSRDITKRKQEESRLAIQARRAEALLTFPGIAETMEEREFMQFGLNLAEKLTGSQIAFIHLVNEDQETIELVSCSNATLEHYCHAAFESHYPISRAGIWADSLRKRTPVIFNDYASAPDKNGLPEGHAHLDRLINVPVIEGGLVRMMVGVGNKPEPYADLDVETVQLVSYTIWNIVSHRRARITMRDSQELLEMAGKMAHMGGWAVDLSKQRVIWSDEVCAIHEMPSGTQPSMEEAVNFYAPESIVKIKEAVEKCISDGVTFDEELQIVTANGRNVCVRAIGQAIRNDKGVLTRVHGAFQDISERKRAEEKLRVANAVVENSPTVLFRWKAEDNWLVEYVSENIQQQFGYTPDDLLTGRVPFSKIIHPDDLTRVEDEVAAHTASGAERFTQEYRIVTSDGRIRWIDDITSVGRDKNGNVAHYEGVILDKTERKLAEDSLVKLSLAVEQSSSSIIISDLYANIEYANPAFTKITGYSLEETRGQNPRLLHSGKTPRTTYDDMWAHLTRGESWQGEFINKRKNGEEYTERVMISPVRQTDGRVTNYLAIKEDITEKKEAEARIEKLIHFDLLTGLPNRALLNEHVKHNISLAQRNNMQMTVMFLDLDHFKNINNTLGHIIGDEMLIQLANRLKLELREEDTVSRLGGDEFILIFPGTTAINAAHLAEKLLAVVSAPYQISQQELIVTSSIGIALYPDDGEDFETLSKNADLAMYRAKNDGRNSFRFFASEMQVNLARALKLGNSLRFALQRNQLRLHYQPQVAIEDGRIIGAEALIRWEHPEMGMISPAEFIPLAEESGQILQIGEWVLRTAVRQLKTWIDNGLSPMIIAVNLSAVQFRHPNLPELVTKILDEEQLPPQYLELELTEAVAMDDPLNAITVMNNLHERGIHMSIDDFGTGYSSLSYLKKFKVYKLKIDQSFVHDITEDADDKAIVTAIINMASSLGFQTIAEGVETLGQLEYLREQGCDEIQGYYFSKPLPAEQFETFVRDKQAANAGLPLYAQNKLA